MLPILRPGVQALDGGPQQDLLPEGDVHGLRQIPVDLHAVEYLRRELEGAGYTPLSEGRSWSAVPGGKYYAVRGGSALIAFRVPIKRSSLSVLSRQ